MTSKSIGKGIRAFTLLLFFIHFTLTILYVGPLNPMKVNCLPILDIYIGRFFPQNWNLFAPNPLSSDQLLLVHGLTDEDLSQVGTKGLPSDGWEDISSPFWEKFQRNRFSAYDRLIRPQSTSLRQYLNGDQDMDPLYAASQKGDSESQKILDQRLKEVREHALKMLVKVASAYFNDTDRSRRFSHVALRLRISNPVAWSDRYSGTKQFKDIELGIFPIDRSIIGTGLYKERSAP